MDLTYPQAEAVREKINSDPLPGKLTCLNSQGNKTICAYSSKTYNGWFLVGSIEVSALSQASVQWSLLLVTTLAFALLIAVNSVYFLLLNKRLRESLAAVEHANAAKTRFLSTMSHDIRTPMNAILGMAAIAQSNLDNREKVEECLRKLLLAGKHLLTLINDVLDISKVESGSLRSARQPSRLPRRWKTSSISSIRRHAERISGWMFGFRMFCMKSFSPISSGSIRFSSIS